MDREEAIAALVTERFGPAPPKPPRRRASALDNEFAARQLARVGVAARLLHIEPRALSERKDQLQRERFEFEGHRYTGISYVEIVRMHRMMWPACQRPDCEAERLLGPSTAPSTPVEARGG